MKDIHIYACTYIYIYTGKREGERERARETLSFDPNHSVVLPGRSLMKSRTSARSYLGCGLLQWVPHVLGHQQRTTRKIYVKHKHRLAGCRVTGAVESEMLALPALRNWTSQLWGKRKLLQSSLKACLQLPGVLWNLRVRAEVRMRGQRSQLLLCYASSKMSLMGSGTDEFKLFTHINTNINVCLCNIMYIYRWIYICTYI